MEPRPYSRGNLSRSLRHSRHQQASMEPRPFSRGNTDRCLAVYRGLFRFNGAAAFQPRKRGEESLVGPVGWYASMEPRPFSRGNGQPSFLAAIREGRFNGAAAFQPRKHDETVRRLKQLPMLQWSRGLSAAETTMDLT